MSNQHAYCRSGKDYYALESECHALKAEVATYIQHKVLSDESFKKQKENLDALESKLDIAREALRKCRKLKDAKAIIMKNGFIFSDLDDRWQKLAFTFYTDLCELDRKSEDALGRLEG